MAKKDGAAAKDGPPIEGLSFEQALAELEDIVRRLEAGDVELDAAISAYERGALLKRHCESKLRQAEERVRKIQLDGDGEARISDANDDNEPPF